MELEVFKSTVRMFKTSNTIYELMAGTLSFEGKNALRELKQYAKEKGYTSIRIYTPKTAKSIDI